MFFLGYASPTYCDPSFNTSPYSCMVHFKSVSDFPKYKIQVQLCRDLVLNRTGKSSYPAHFGSLKVFIKRFNSIVSCIFGWLHIFVRVKSALLGK